MPTSNYAKVPVIRSGEAGFFNRFKPIDSGNLINWQLVETLPATYGNKKPDGDAIMTSNMPTQPYHVAIKKYVDEGFVALDKSTGTGTDSAYVRSDADGRTLQRKLRYKGTPEASWIADIAAYTSRATLFAADPTEAQDLVTLNYFNNNVPTTFKTLFGNQSIKGTGNIDLYQHSVTIVLKNSSTAAEVSEANLLIYSSKNLPIDSLTDLKTILGNSFKVPATGVHQNVFNVISVTSNGLNTIQSSGAVLVPFADYSTSFTDVVTTI